MPIRILLAEGHPMLRQAMKSLLMREGFNVVAESAGLDPVGLAAKILPDVAVLDVSMNGFDVARGIRRVSGRTKLIIFTMFREGPFVEEALHAGSNGYVLKSDPPTTLPEAIRAVHRGDQFLSPGLSRVDSTASRLSIIRDAALAERLNRSELPFDTPEDSYRVFRDQHVRTR